jgi:YD repeat-containing protein
MRYDANGNVTQLPAPGSGTTTLAYDGLNRLVTASNGSGTETYASNRWNQRVWVLGTDGTEHVNLYGLDGELLGNYKVNWSAASGPPGNSRRWGAVLSVREEKTATGNNKEKFATYYRDTISGLDYAVNRYYSSSLGKVLMPDPALPRTLLCFQGTGIGMPMLEEIR